MYGHALRSPASVPVLILTCCLECCLELPWLRDFSLAFGNSSVTSSVRPSVAPPERETLALFVLPESPTYFCSSNADMGEGVLIVYHKLRALQQPKFILSYSLEVRNLRLRCQPGYILSGGFRGESISLPFPASSSHLHSLAHRPLPASL